MPRKVRSELEENRAISGPVFQKGSGKMEVDPLTRPRFHGRMRSSAVIVLVHLIVGCFMDGFVLIVLTVPILLPLIHTLGINMYWFGIIILFTGEI